MEILKKKKSSGFQFETTRGDANKPTMAAVPRNFLVNEKLLLACWPFSLSVLDTWTGGEAAVKK